MFSTEKRCHYRRSPLADVICQLRFPEILAISANAPVEFQEAIRDIFPQYRLQKDTPAPKITGSPGHFSLENTPAVVNHQFASADGVWRVNLTSRFISLTCSRYTSWEDFARWLDRPLAAFIRIYQPAYFERVGLRYLNFFSRRELELEGVPFSQLFSPCYLGPLMEEDVREASLTRCSVDTEMAIRGGCRVKLHAGPGLVKRGNQADSEVRFIFDQDLFMPGQLPVNLSAGALQTLHAQANTIFRGAITEKMHEALEPEDI